jgi:hypothetical protein
VNLGSLTRFARRVRRDAEGERCDLCGVAIAERHRHVVDRLERRLLCACAACGPAFVDVRVGRFRTVPERVRRDESGTIEKKDLQTLGVPVGLAFFFRSSALERWVGIFPSPAGPTEAELPEGAWETLVAKSEIAAAIEADVEALLVRSERDGRTHVFLVPIDVCYALTALLRSGWRGIDGGDEARRALDDFFAALAERAARRGGS